MNQLVEKVFEFESEGMRVGKEGKLLKRFFSHFVDLKRLEGNSKFMYRQYT